MRSLPHTLVLRSHVHVSIHSPAVQRHTYTPVQLVGEVYRRNGAWHIEDPLKRLLPSLGLWEEYGFVQASVAPLALDALKVRHVVCVCVCVMRW